MAPKFPASRNKDGKD